MDFIENGCREEERLGGATWREGATTGESGPLFSISDQKATTTIITGVKLYFLGSARK